MRPSSSSSSYVTSGLTALFLLFSGASPAPTAPDGSLSWSDAEPLFTFHYSTSQPDGKNWIGLYNSFYGAPDNESYVANSLAWSYAPEGDGSVKVTPPKNLPPGQYRAFLLARDGYQHLAHPVDVVSGNGSLSFLIDEFTTRNGREGDAFEVSIKGLLTNQKDTKTKFTKMTSEGDGNDWVTVSGDGTISGKPDASGERRVTIEATSSVGSKAQLKVKIPIRSSGSSLVDRIGVLSFNMWHGGSQVNDYHRKQVRYLASSNVDIVGLQESNGGHAVRLGQALGWDSWQGRDVGIISRYPIVERFDLTQAGGAVRIALDGDASQIIAWNAHLGYTPYGPYDFCYDHMTVEEVMKNEAVSGRTPQIIEIMDRMKTHIADSDRVPVLLTGDMNAPSHLDWTEATRSQHCNVGAVPWPSSEEPIKGGLIDSYREVHKDPAADPGITWSPIQLENDGRPEPLDRIDFVYHKGLKVVDSVREVVGKPEPEPNHWDNEWTTDHAAVRSTFQVPAKQNKRDVVREALKI
ncbi:DNase I-like protein [Ophiocordyceps camponoti-floridani]|uniref:DNase I-like protein n=1 Tax=Ophiocordyceps camponoti-floridani TaxID=2030778 RepID=A0A8H4VDM3_9HYPO|nr:DNase I-like protein [Ophiocordyceps camponoti-floridani]